MTSRVSFVVPCYNYGRYVGHAIDSLLSQTHDDLELIVIDDASTDNTPDVLRPYKAESRVRLVRHDQNLGHIRTYNEGLALTTGDYVGLMSADDFCLVPDAIRRQVAVFDNNIGVGMVFSSHVWFHDERVESQNIPEPEDYVHRGLDEFRRLMWEDYIPASGTLLRRELQFELNLYDPALPHAADWDLWLRASTRADVGYIAEPLFGYRLHSDNMHHTQTSPRQAIQEIYRVLDKAFGALPPDAPPEIWAARKAVYVHGALQTAWTDLFHRRPRRTLIGLIEAARLRPSILRAREPWSLAARLLLCLNPVWGRSTSGQRPIRRPWGTVTGPRASTLDRRSES